MDCIFFSNNVCLQSYYVCTWSTLPTLSTLSYQSSSLPSPINVLVYIDLVYVSFFCVCLYVPSLFVQSWCVVTVKIGSRGLRAPAPPRIDG